MLCDADQCDRPAAAKGSCLKHYKAAQRRAAGKQHRGLVVSCAVPGCVQTGKFVRGYCSKHYTRVKRQGEPGTTEDRRFTTGRVESVEFNGITFRRYPDSDNAAHRRYFTPNGVARGQGIQNLHQEVWKATHGPIPDGHHVHHINGDHADNSVENLVCLAPGEHWAEHAEQRSRTASTPEQLTHLAAIRPLAAAWHRSPEGREWHRQHAIRTGFGRRLQLDH